MAQPIYFFNSNVPQSSQTIKSTQKPILSNFLSINEWVNVNHVGFNDPINYGKHNFTTFPAQSMDPSTGSSDCVIYSKLTSSAYGIELFYRYPSNGSVFQLTGGSGGGSLAATNGYAYLTPTLLFKWGVASISTTGSSTVTFPTAGGIPAFTTAVYNLQTSPAATYNISSTVPPYITNITLTNFVINAPSSGYSNSIYWFAIGV